MALARRILAFRTPIPRSIHRRTRKPGPHRAVRGTPTEDQCQTHMLHSKTHSNSNSPAGIRSSPRQYRKGIGRNRPNGTTIHLYLMTHRLLAQRQEPSRATLQHLPHPQVALLGTGSAKGHKRGPGANNKPDRRRGHSVDIKRRSKQARIGSEGDGYAYTDEEQEKAYAKGQAQRDFDAMLERERSGEEDAKRRR